MQSTYWDSFLGEYSGGSLWTDAVGLSMEILTQIIIDLSPQNALEDLHNLMLGADINTWSSVADDSYIGRLASLELSSGEWEILLDGSNDDAQVYWYILLYFQLTLA